MTTDKRVELLDLLAESRQQLDDATRIEKRKRWATQHRDLPEAVQWCREATEPAFQRAIVHLEQTDHAISRANRTAENLRKAVDNTSTGITHQQSMAEINRLLEGLEKTQTDVRETIGQKMQDAQTYNVTLFGRSMTGKSTLMEILTQGDGRSIGNGTQRTTTDVRQYEWKGINITDVPGVAAFNGEQDEQTAHDAAAQADLIIFLVTNDPPQNSEAVHLARIRRSGKPVIGICNVKRALNGNAAISRFIKKDQHRLFNLRNLDDLSVQFDLMADQYTPGRQLELVNTHLMARFEAERQPSQTTRDALMEASRFWEVEDLIVNEIVSNGPFLRRRAFIDTAATAALETWDQLQENVDITEQMQKRLTDRCREIQQFQSAFRRAAKRKLDILISNTVGELRNQAPAFADQYCEDKNIQQYWKRSVDSADINGKLQRAIQEITDDCRGQLSDLVVAIETEMAILTKDHESAIQHETIKDTRHWIKWGSIGASSALGLAGTGAGALGIAGLSLPLLAIPGINVVVILGIAAGLVGLAGRLISRLFGSKTEKHREAAQRVAEQLSVSLNKTERDIRDTFNEWYNEVDHKTIKPSAEYLLTLAEATRDTTSITSTLADQQRDTLLELNQELVDQALMHVGHQSEFEKIAATARIPGQAITLTLRDRCTISDDAIESLEGVLGESVHYISQGTPASTIIANACGIENVHINEDESATEVPYDANEPNIQVAVRLASQVTGVRITNDNRSRSMAP